MTVTWNWSSFYAKKQALNFSVFAQKVDLFPVSIVAIAKYSGRNYNFLSKAYYAFFVQKVKNMILYINEGNTYVTKDKKTDFIRCQCLKRFWQIHTYQRGKKRNLCLARRDIQMLSDTPPLLHSEDRWIKFRVGKGQLIWKGLFGVIVSTKKPTIFFKNFGPSL